MAQLRDANTFFQKQEAWKMTKRNDHRTETVFAFTMESLRVCSILLQPVTPTLCSKTLDILGVPSGERTFKHSKQFCTKEQKLCFPPSGAHLINVKVLKELRTFLKRWADAVECTRKMMLDFGNPCIAKVAQRTTNENVFERCFFETVTCLESTAVLFTCESSALAKLWILHEQPRCGSTPSSKVLGHTKRAIFWKPVRMYRGRWMYHRQRAWAYLSRGDACDPAQQVSAAAARGPGTRGASATQPRRAGPRRRLAPLRRTASPPSGLQRKIGSLRHLNEYTFKFDFFVFLNCATTHTQRRLCLLPFAFNDF